MMRKFLILICLLSLALAGCATTPTTTTPGVVTTTGILSDSTVNTTQKVLLAMGAILQATPGTNQVLLDEGKITKDQFNSIVPIYNKALAAWNVAVDALKVGASADLYNAAFSAFLGQQTDLNALLTEFGVTVGGVK